MKKDLWNNHAYMFKIVFQNEKCYFGVLFLYILVIYAAPFVLIVFPRYILDDLLAEQPFERVMKRILLMAACYFLIHFFIQVLKVLKLNLELKLKAKLNTALSAKCMKLDYSDIEDNEVVNTVNSAKMAIGGGLTYTQAIGLSGEQGLTGYFTQLGDLAANILKAVTLFYILSKLEIWVLGIILLGLILNCNLSRKKKKANVELRNYAAPFLRKNQYCNRVLRSFEAGKDIRLYHLEDYLLGKFSECNHEYINAKNKYKFKLVSADMLSVLCETAVTFCIYFSLIYLLLKGEVTVGEFTMISGATITLFSCGTAMIASLMDLDILSIFMSDFKKIMTRRERVWQGVKPLSGGGHTIEFEHVSFRYRNAETEALRDINIKIESGDSISIVGSNGAGKSTFIKLLIGLYQPSSGRILIDGCPMEEYKREDLTTHMSVLFQDFQLYSMTVEENVAMNANSERAKFEASIQEGGIKKRIEKMPQREKTELLGYFTGEEEALSGGEEQKLALARAFYKDSQMVILDEPTAALDALAECEIYERMLDHVENKTVVFVSHRMASAKFCKRIVVFDKGMILEEGDHRGLLEKNGLYKKMWDTQAQYYNREGIR